MGERRKKLERSGIRRRQASQARSEARVEAIMQAAVTLLERDGYAALSTNRIARFCGISIGSLYQYFPNLEVLLEAVYENAVANIAIQAKSAVFGHIDDSIQNALPDVIDTTLALAEKYAAVLVVLPEELPELRRSTHALSLEMLVQSANRAYVSRHYRELVDEALEIRLYFTCTVLLETIRKYIQDKPAFLSREQFIANLSKMIIYYLDGSAADVLTDRSKTNNNEDKKP